MAKDTAFTEGDGPEPHISQADFVRSSPIYASDMDHAQLAETVVLILQHLKLQAVETHENCHGEAQSKVYITLENI